MTNGPHRCVTSGQQWEFGIPHTYRIWHSPRWEIANTYVSHTLKPPSLYLIPTGMAALPADQLDTDLSHSPSSAFCNHSINFFIWSKNSIFPLTEWPSLYHFRITSSDRTSAVTNNTVNSQVFCDVTLCRLARSYCFGGVCCLNSRVLGHTDSDYEGRVDCVLVHFGCDIEKWILPLVFVTFIEGPQMWHKSKGKGHPCTGTEALYRPYGP